MGQFQLQKTFNLFHNGLTMMRLKESARKNWFQKKAILENKYQSLNKVKAVDIWILLFW